MINDSTPANRRRKAATRGPAGFGIHAAARKRRFLPFVRLRGGEGPSGPGFGLGRRVRPAASAASPRAHPWRVPAPGRHDNTRVVESRQNSAFFELATGSIHQVANPFRFLLQFCFVELAAGFSAWWYRVAVERDTPALFDQIAAGYDTTNWLMTGGLWGVWRAAFARHAPIARGSRVLDVGCGTAELSLLLARMGAGEVVGVDLSEGMLARGRAKVERSPHADRIHLQRGDAMALPFADASFDAAASAFVMRNVPDLDRMLAEMVRVVRPGGAAVVMELSHPPSKLARGLFTPFFRVMPPVLGRLLRGPGGSAAYGWLPESLARFPGAEALAARMAAAGLADVSFRRLTAGIVCLHMGRRPLPRQEPLY